MPLCSIFIEKLSSLVVEKQLLHKNLRCKYSFNLNNSSEEKKACRQDKSEARIRTNKKKKYLSNKFWLTDTQCVLLEVVVCAKILDIVMRSK